MPTTPARIVTLRAAGTCFAVELTEPVPRVLHWGADLGELTDADLAALSLTAEPAILNNSLDILRRFTAVAHRGRRLVRHARPPRAPGRRRRGPAARAGRQLPPPRPGRAAAS